MESKNQKNMKSSLKMLVFVLLSMLISCNESSSENESQTEEMQQSQVIQQESTSVAVKIITATYQQATVYTGRTDYLFEDEIGGMLMVEYSNFDEIPPIELPENMLENDEELEGPPGANPELIGKKFKISYNEEGNVYKIELAEKLN